MTLIFEFVLNIHHFSLLIEIFLLGTITIIYMLIAFAETDTKYKTVKNFFDILISLIGINLLILSILDVVNAMEKFANYQTLKEFSLPIILTIAFIPFAYIIAVYMNYELLFVKFRMYFGDNERLEYSKRRALIHCGLSLKKIRDISPFVLKEFHADMNKIEIKDIL